MKSGTWLKLSGTNTFNGIPLPSIAVMDKAGNCRMIKEFGYEDFKNRLS